MKNVIYLLETELLKTKNLYQTALRRSCAKDFIESLQERIREFERAIEILKRDRHA